MPELDYTYLDREIRALLLRTGKFIEEEFQHFSRNRIDYKGLGNPFTYVDVTAEEMLKAGCNELFPEAAFMGEETATDADTTGWVWIIDPVDGTVNFIHGVPFFCISLALSHGEDVHMGYIYQPSTGDLWAAQKGRGATLNGHPIAVSEVTAIADSLIATGFPYDSVPWPEAYFQALSDFQHMTHGVRRFGSAALDLAYVATGRCEAFYEYNLKPWDIAAGSLLVTEAGGKVSDFRGENQFLFGRQIIATNARIHADVLATLHRRIPALSPS